MSAHSRRPSRGTFAAGPRKRPLSENGMADLQRRVEGRVRTAVSPARLELEKVRGQAGALEIEWKKTRSLESRGEIFLKLNVLKAREISAELDYYKNVLFAWSQFPGVLPLSPKILSGIHELSGKKASSEIHQGILELEKLLKQPKFRHDRKKLMRAVAEISSLGMSFDALGFGFVENARKQTEARRVAGNILKWALTPAGRLAGVAVERYIISVISVLRAQNSVASRLLGFLRELRGFGIGLNVDHVVLEKIKETENLAKASGQQTSKEIEEWLGYGRLFAKRNRK